MTVTFEDLPMDVLEKVVGGSMLSDCLALRKVSPDLRNLVDSSEICCESIDFLLGRTDWRFCFKDLTLKYEKDDDGGCMVTSNRKETQKTKTYRDDRNFKEAMIADASTFLNNPKLKIDQIRLNRYEPAVEFFEFLKSLESPLNVRSIESADLRNLHSVLPFLKPENLEEAILENSFFTVDQFNRITKSDASAILKIPKLKISDIYFDDYSNESSATFFGILKSLDNQLRFGSIYILTGEERWISPVLTSLDPEIMENITFGCVDLTIDQFNQLAGMEQWRKRTELFNCRLPPNFRFEQLVGFKEFEDWQFEVTDENLVTVRDIILKSPHFKRCCLPFKREMFKKFERFMEPEYNVETRRLSIPNSLDLFQLEYRESGEFLFVTIERIPKN